MSKVSQFRRPLAILAMVLVADLIGRLALDFEMRPVLVLETLVFGAACLLFLWAASRDRSLSATAVKVDLVLALIFGLGSIRAELWWAGLPVGRANIIVLGLGVFVVVGYLVWRRMFRRNGAG